MILQAQISKLREGETGENQWLSLQHWQVPESRIWAFFHICREVYVYIVYELEKNLKEGGQENVPCISITWRSCWFQSVWWLWKDMKYVNNNQNWKEWVLVWRWPELGKNDLWNEDSQIGTFHVFSDHPPREILPAYNVGRTPQNVL